MKTIVFDLETTTHDIRKRFCNPFAEENRIVCFSYLFTDAPEIVYVHDDLERFLNDVRTANTLIGQNIKFDLLYVLCATKDPQILKDKTIYDTKFVEYLLTYQQNKTASLNDLSVKYGGTLKDDRIKEFWDAGIDTTEIPQDILYEYAKYDVINTHKVYQGQQKLIWPELRNLIDSQMEDLLATTLIEYNGIYVDKAYAKTKIEELGETDYTVLDRLLPALPFVFNWQSNQHLSSFIFGGDVPYDDKEPILDKEGVHAVFKSGAKSGQLRYKNIVKLYTFPQQVKPKPEWKTKQGFYQVSDEVLDSIKNKNKDINFIVSVLSSNRDKHKQISTYYEPMIALSGDDGLIHAEFGHTWTNTGRLSSRKPNMQNWSKHESTDVKACIRSRWENGVIIEIDASQLEIVVQAYLAQDERMIAELNKGTDFHCLRLAAKENKTYDEVYKLCKVDKDKAWDVKRTNTKAFSFQRAYGAGAQAISKSTGLSIEDVKKLIETEDALFPSVKLFNDTNIETVTKTKQVLYGKDSTTIIGKLPSITGRIYSFEEEDAPDFLQKRGILKSFSPTQIKNYPIQGFGAEILAEFRGNLARKLIGREDRVVMINTVHDSIIFDCKDEIKELFMQWLKKESEKVVYLIQIRYNLVVNVPLKFDIKYGKNWKELEDYI